MKKALAILLSCSMILTGCSVKDVFNSSSENTTTDTEQNTIIETEIESTLATESTETDEQETVTEITNLSESEYPLLSVDTSSEEYITSLGFTSLNDPDFMQYIEDTVYSDLENQLGSDDYVVEDVETVYISKEYLDELDYNSQENIYFGYTLSELDELFHGEKYIFTLGENGQTDVVPFEEYDDTYDKVIRNVAIGTGVILVCVTITVLTGGTGGAVVGTAAKVNALFATAAERATTYALSTGVISGVTAGIAEGIETHDFDKALKAAAIKGSEGFMWGAIAGAAEGAIEGVITNGIGQYEKIKNVSESVEPLENPPTFVDDVIAYDFPSYDGLSNWQAAEIRAQQILGGTEQLSYLNGTEVAMNIKGATRPDLIRRVGETFEAVEVKAWDLEHNLSGMCSELKRQVGERVANLPEGYTQRIFLDVTGRGYTREFMEQAIAKVSSCLRDIYANIPINVIGA